MMTNTLPQKIFRNTEPEYAKAFVEGGEIMFRSLTYYRTIEDAARRDELEGMVQSNAAGQSIEVDFGDGIYKPLVKFEIGTHTQSEKRADRLYICCLSLTPQEGFGPTTIEIFDVIGFLKHIRLVLIATGHELDHGPVEYYDPKEPTKPGLPSKLWRKKRIIFMPEHEFRITFLVEDVVSLSTQEYCEISELNDAGMPKYIKLKFGSLKKFAWLM